MKRKTVGHSQNFDAVQSKIASPEDVLSWSFGEVENSETIHYRTQKPWRGGLFDEKIFGPEHDFQCSCGKYKGVQYSGIECDKCGVEVVRASVRRERMGHIDLVCPIAHIWYLRKIPSRVAQILDITSQNIQKVVYFSAHIITDVDEDALKKVKKKIEEEYTKKTASVSAVNTVKEIKKLYTARMNELKAVKVGEILDEAKYNGLNKNFPKVFKAGIGGEAVYELLKRIDLKKLEKNVINELDVATEPRKEKLYKILSLTRSFLQNKTRPEWMFFTKFPVLPPGIRPIVALDGGRYASSDLNDLYRKVIDRNNRLKRLLDIDAPEVIIRNEKRLLQESVDSLIDGSIKYNTTNVLNRSVKKPKSISEHLRGKKGYFRSNLLGKRVDFSARSVIVVGAHLNFDQCGLPKEIALELFRPFIIAELMKRELSFNIRGASKLIDEKNEVVWEILEKVSKDKYVLLGRCPTLHRQNIMAFKPLLTEGKAIEIHPLVCKAYNADFDGDQMAVHLLLSEEAQIEAKEIMASNKNIIDPATGSIIMAPTQDMVLGCYFATSVKNIQTDDDKKIEKYYASPNEAITAYDFDRINLRDEITILPTSKGRYKNLGAKPFKTSIGKILFNNLLPTDFPFVNEALDKSKLDKMIEEISLKYSEEVLVQLLDKIKKFGFDYATESGISLSIDDLVDSPQREEFIQEGYVTAQKFKEQYAEGLLSEKERKRKGIELWINVKNKISDSLKGVIPEENSLRMMIKSGARGSMGDLVVILGMFGLVQSGTKETVEHPITESFKRGLNPIEFFIVSYGARTTTADTALRTADAGYLSRKLFDVGQELNIVGSDCRTTQGFPLYRISPSGIKRDFARYILGRFTSESVVGSGGKEIIGKNKQITKEISEKIEADESVAIVKVRSPLSCKYTDGICQKCYGSDYMTRKTVDIGEPVGTIAAQSIGEPGTQLTMRTFHSGGAASIGGDITLGLPRVKQLFNKQKPKSPAIVAHINGIVDSIEDESTVRIIHIKPLSAVKVGIKDTKYAVSKSRYITVKVGEEVKKGQFLTDGSADLDELYIYLGKLPTQEYIMEETAKIYELQGARIAPVHFEIIIAQMFTRSKVVSSGDSMLTTGDIIENEKLKELNAELIKENKEPIKAIELIYGITNVSTSRNNFLSAASFQDTTKVLINAALRGAVDTLSGLKENVIIGRLIPVGTGLAKSVKANIIEEETKKLDIERAKRLER